MESRPWGPPLLRGKLGTGKPRREGWKAVRGPVEAIWEEEHPKPEVGEASRKEVRGQWRRRQQLLDHLAEEMLKISHTQPWPLTENHKKSPSPESYIVPRVNIESEFTPSGRKGKGQE